MNNDLVTGGDVLQGRYRLEERLGSGGMASVWRATDEVLGRTVALKVLDNRSLSDPQSKSRLQAEAKLLARLNHPRIAAVYDFGFVDGVPYLVMELVDGVTLSALTNQPGGVAWQLVVRICAQVAQALEVAHARGLVHRDVSPSNILWTDSGVKVIDFGLCASTGDPEETDGLLGTPAYMAPERIEGESVRPASDVYALGVVLYRALTNHLPWPTESVMQLLGAHRRLPPLPLDAPGVPASVRRICEQCMAKDPADRPSAAEVATVLSAAVDGENVAVAPEDEPTMAANSLANPLRTVPILIRKAHVPRPVALAASAVGLVAATGLATTWMTHSTPQTHTMPPADQVAAVAADCHVDYRVTNDTGQRFTATITVRNTGDEAYKDWHLVFGLPGDQRVEGSDWVDDQGVVKSAARADELAPGTAVDMAFAGTYSGTNPFPTAFVVDDQKCSASLLGVSASPVVPVTVVAPSPSHVDTASATVSHATGDNGPAPRHKAGKHGHGHGKK
jgi:eukaryotic-like serine/threonine-protein kinase